MGESEQPWASGAGYGKPVGSRRIRRRSRRIRREAPAPKAPENARRRRNFFKIALRNGKNASFPSSLVANFIPQDKTPVLGSDWRHVTEMAFQTPEIHINRAGSDKAFVTNAIANS